MENNEYLFSTLMDQGYTEEELMIKYREELEKINCTNLSFNDMF